MHHRQAFTLIELLIVIAVIAIISVVIVLILNPTELLRQARDSNRLSDMASMVDAFNIYAGEGGTSYGSANTVYVSIPDPTATSSLGDQCQGLGLISLPATYSYHCGASSTYRAIDGTGWIPVNFNAVSSRSPLGELPIDPVNTSSSRFYYTYTTNGSQYEMTSVMESQKYGLGGSNDVISGDGGTLASVYERGTQLGLEPLDYGDSSLVGYWPLDEGTGTVAYDYSGDNATGSWQGTQTGTNGYYSAGKVGSWAGAFSTTTTNYINMGDPADLTFGAGGSMSASAWIKTTSNGSIIDKKFSGSNTAGYDLDVISNQAFFRIANGSAQQSLSSSTVTDGQWHLLVGVQDESAGLLRIYVDGVQLATLGYNTSWNLSSANNFNVGGFGANANFSGLINDVRIYNRALSAAQIAAMYNGGK